MPQQLGAAGGAGVANIASHNFNDGTRGPFTDFGVPQIDYPPDPTGSGRGNVNRILYSVPATFLSNDVNMVFDAAHRYRYSEDLWVKGDVWIPSTLSDGVTPKTTLQHNDTRKLLDLFNSKCRVIIERSGSGKDLVYVAGFIEPSTGLYHEDIHIANTGIVLADDTWNTIKLHVRPNSADGVSDGLLELFINGSLTPNVSAGGMRWITDGVNGGTADQQAAFNMGGTAFQSFRHGTQLTTFGIGEDAYSEYRYWDNMGISTTDIA